MKNKQSVRRAFAAALVVCLSLLSLPAQAFTFPWSRPEGAVSEEAQDSETDDSAPIARNMELSTYRNVPVTAWFDAVDSEGEVLSFQLTSTPARGSVELAQDGSGQFTYSPYENKTGKDSFTYVALDPEGNSSAEAKVSIRINKAGTKITYSDLEGSGVQKAAVRLAEKGIYLGAQVNGVSFFRPEERVSRGEFLSMAMAVSGMEPLQGVTRTGFYDDEAIPTWCKGFVSSALMAGAVRGSVNEAGQCIFDAEQPITHAEAAVMLNAVLGVTDVPVETFSGGASDHWAGQACANLTSAGVMRSGTDSAETLSAALTRAEAALLLDGALDLMEARG